MPAQQPFILASASPRRKDLLSEAGYKFEVIISGIDESSFSSENVSPEKYAAILAMAKVKDVANQYPDRLVVGADTIADFDGRIIGKAQNPAHAEQITRKLFSKPHKVITAIAMVRIEPQLQIVQAESTIVHPKKLNEAQIAEHIRHGTWQDKAGAYAIQETGDEFVERIEGSLTNVMGLGMELFAKMFKKWAK